MTSLVERMAQQIAVLLPGASAAEVSSAKALLAEWRQMHHTAASVRTVPIIATAHIPYPGAIEELDEALVDIGELESGYALKFLPVADGKTEPAWFAALRTWFAENFPGEVFLMMQRNAPVVSALPHYDWEKFLEPCDDEDDDEGLTRS